MIPLRALVPRALRQAMRAMHRTWTLRRAFFEADGFLSDSASLTDSLVESLVYGWNNEGWSAKPSLLRYLLREHGRFSGTMLECGSGLTTAIMALVARRTGAQVISLEHDAAWFDLVRRRMVTLGLPAGQLRMAPLRDYGGYDWYDVGDEFLKGRMIDLVLCDGPPSGTTGGRSGLLPQVAAHLRQGALIIVDDSHRAAEAEMIHRWREASDGRIVMESEHDTFAVLRCL